VEDKAKKLKTDIIKEQDEDEIQKKLSNYKYDLMVKKAKKYIKQNCKSKEQMEIVTTFLQYFQAIGPHFRRKHHELPSNVTPPLELLTGQPGAGKSTVVKMIMHVANLLQAGHIASTSFNGIAAVNVFGGTICNVFNVQPSYDMNIWNQALQSFTVRGQILKGIRERLHWSTLQMLVIDEVSTIDAFTIAVIDTRLRDVMEQPDKPFGGVAVLMTGDFDQLGPVGKSFLPKDMVEWNLHHLHHKHKSFDMSIYRKGTMVHRGCSLFSQFNRTHLTRQQRSNDFHHNSNILRMTMGQPICTEELDIYEDFHLSSQSSSPDWQFPTFIVASNRERNDIIKMQAQRFAIQNNTYVIKWKNRVRCWKNKPKGNSMQEAFDDNSFMWQYFVKGAPCFIKQNINTALGIANGSEAKQHSLCFLNNDQAQEFAALVTGPSAPPYGSEIILEQAPLSVNVEITFPEREAFLNHVQDEQERLLRLHSLSSSKSSAVIPITTQSTNGAPKDFKYYILPRDKEQQMSCARVYSEFPIELGFAVTVHLAQGRTIPKVVVSISEPPSSQSCLRFKYSSLFVALSRVRNSADMKFLYKEDTREEALEYLKDLTPDPHTRLYNAGFQNSSGIWNCHLSTAASYKQSHTQ
jgi:hypothetical protein